jgi:hypothetical protein
MKIAILGLIGLIGIIFAVGYFLPSERLAKRTAKIKASPEIVFAKVTDISNQKWRSNVEKVEVVDLTPGQEVWTEYPKKGPPIKFRTKGRIPLSRFEIEIIDNPQFGGHWVGTFAPVGIGETEIEFTEKVMVIGIIPKIMSYIFFDVDESVEVYLADLKKVIEQ